MPNSFVGEGTAGIVRRSIEPARSKPMVNATQSQSWRERVRMPQWRNFLPLLLKSIVIVLCLMLLAGAVVALSVVSVATCMHPEKAFEPLKSLADWSTSCHSLSLVQTRTPPPAPKAAKKR
jgi:hypothetical protein